jgi:parallel beta-helix repeat protein
MHRREFTKSLSLLAAGFFTDLRTRSRALPLLLVTDRFDVRDFGARGDGLNDDSAAFGKALVRAAKNGGNVFVPPGKFLVNKTIRIRDGVTISGAGSDSVIEHVGGDPIAIICAATQHAGVAQLQIRGRFAFGIVIDACASLVVSRCVISGGTLRWSPTAFCGGILAMNSNDISIDGNTLTGNGLIRSGVLSSDIQVNGFGKNTQSDAIRVIGNQCRSTATQCCISAYDLRRSEISSNTCTGAKTGHNNNNGYGIMIYQTAGSPGSCVDNVVANNRVSNTQGTAIYLQQSNSSRVVANVIDDVSNVQDDATLPVGGVALNQSQHVMISDNRISRVGRAGISIASNRAGVGHVEVTRNTIEHTRGMGIHLRGLLTDINVSNNTVTDTNGGIGSSTPDALDQIIIVGNIVSATADKSPGIVLANATRSTIKNNRVSDSGGYGLALTLRDDESVVKGNTVARSGRGGRGKYADVHISRAKKPSLQPD